MIEPEPFIDIHCHLLPGLDDGAATLDHALAMAQMATDDGIRTIVATPHQLGNHAQNSGASIRAATVRFQQQLDQQRMPLQVLPGADVRIEPDLVRKIRAGEVLTLADRRRHVLLELPHDVYVSLDRLLAELHAAQLVGILSHPERNRGILNRPDVLRPLVDRGCLMQITAGSLLGVFGSQVMHFAESMVEQGLVHFVSTDAHGIKSRPPLLNEAFDRVADIVGHSTAVNLCCRNPAAVAKGEAVSLERQQSKKSTWISWFQRTISSRIRRKKPIVEKTCRHSLGSK